MYKILTFGLGRKPISIERTYETLEEALQSAVTWWGEIGRSRGQPGPPALWLRHDGDRTPLTPVGSDPDTEQAIEIWK